MRLLLTSNIAHWPILIICSLEAMSSVAGDVVNLLSPVFEDEDEWYEDFVSAHPERAWERDDLSVLASHGTSWGHEISSDDAASHSEVL